MSAAKGHQDNSEIGREDANRRRNESAEHLIRREEFMRAAENYLKNPAAGLIHSEKEQRTAAGHFT
jgi:hypothetical protein